MKILLTILQERNVRMVSRIQIRRFFILSFNNGGKSERTCIVPAGKGLLIPVMQVVITDKDIPGASVEELDYICKKGSR